MSTPERVSGAPDRFARWAAHPLGPAVLFLSAVAEACLFPAPTEAVYLALAVGAPHRAPLLAVVAAAGGLAGAATGYWMGASLFERMGRPVLEWYGLLPQFDAVGDLYRGSPFLALATSGYTPIPFVLYTIAAGAFHVPLVSFLAGAFAGRAVKYAVLGALAWYLGPAVHAFLARHLRRVMIAVAVLAAVLLLARL